MDSLISILTHVGNFGYVILFVILFLESFPFTFFLPGDSLLFFTGFLASQGDFKLAYLFIVYFIAATLGYFLSYAMGSWVRAFILHSNDRYWFKKKHLDYTHEFFEKYGAKTIIIGRFVPVIRSFGPTLAGAVDMTWSKFVRYTLIGGILWTGIVTTLGFYLGRMFPKAHLYLTPIILAIIFVSLLPTIFEYIQGKRNKNAEQRG